MAEAAGREDPLSPEEFLAFVDSRPFVERWELLDGQPVMMVGGTRVHNAISLNIITALRMPADRQGCDVLGIDYLTSGGERSGFMAAPDVFVRCGPVIDDARYVDDPVIVVEVLSPSTMRHDRVRKFDQYTAMPSVQQIVLVYQDEIRVESFSREGDWPMMVMTTLSDALPLPALEAKLSLAEIYARTNFAT